MPSETSNAPREVWTVNFRDTGQLAGEFPIGDKQTAEDCAVDGSAFFGAECVAVEYVRRDLVVPTVGEIAQRLAERRGLGRPLGSDVADAEELHEWLLSRIEGGDADAG